MHSQHLSLFVYFFSAALPMRCIFWFTIIFYTLLHIKNIIYCPNLNIWRYQPYFAHDFCLHNYWRNRGSWCHYWSLTGHWCSATVKRLEGFMFKFSPVEYQVYLGFTGPPFAWICRTDRSEELNCIYKVRSSVLGGRYKLNHIITLYFRSKRQFKNWPKQIVPVFQSCDLCIMLYF